MKTTKATQPARLFAVAHTSFGPQFAFNAVDQEDGTRKVCKWCHQHGMVASRDGYSAKEITPAELAAGFGGEINNEYIF